MSHIENKFSKLALNAEEQSILDGLSQRQKTMQDKVINWSHINSGSHNTGGLKQMRAELCAAFAALPGELTEPDLASGTFIEPDGVKRKVIYEPAMLLTVRPDADIQIVFTGHYDTVFPKNSHFQTTKILADTKAGEAVLGGPGVADMKGGILVMLEALKAFETTENAHKVGYSVLLSPDEEIGSPGSAPLLAKLGRKAHIGLTYEPSLADGSLAGARKGSGNFAIIIKGRAAHAGREHHLGRNAINATARLTVAMDELNGQREGVTFNMSKIDGGGAVNIVPELAIGRFNVRMLEEDDQVWITDRLAELVAAANKEDGISAELTGGFTRPPKPMAPANALIFDWVKQAGHALGLDIKWKPSGGVCEGNNLWASGCPNVDTLGVRGGEIHSDREFVILPSLSERARLSALILMKIASGEFDAQHAKNLAVENK